MPDDSDEDALPAFFVMRSVLINKDTKEPEPLMARESDEDDLFVLESIR